ncbi:hypothetical protein Trydic_g20477 [Trypoxylus dichotomus]
MCAPYGSGTEETTRTVCNDQFSSTQVDFRRIECISGGNKCLYSITARNSFKVGASTRGEVGGLEGSAGGYYRVNSWDRSGDEKCICGGGDGGG